MSSDLSDRSGTAAKPVFNTAAHGLRGIASLAVFVAHMLGGVGQHVYPQDTGYNEAIAPFWHAGTFGVFLFFIISGFVILPSAVRYAPRDFAWRRFVRIYPLFFVFTALFVVLNALTDRQPDLNDPTTILAALTFTDLFAGTEQLTPNAWSLTYEVMFYVLTCAGIWIGLTIRNRWLFALFLVVAVAFCWRWPKALFFVGGLLVRVLHDREMRPGLLLTRVAEVASLVGLLILACAAKRSFHQIEFLDPSTTLTLVVACLYFYFATDPRSLTGRVLSPGWLRYVGTVSYSLYLAHPYVYLPTRLAFERGGFFTQDSAVSTALFVLVTGALTFAVTHIVYVTLERWPYRACFHRAALPLPNALRKRPEREKRSERYEVAGQVAGPLAVPLAVRPAD